MSDRAAEVQVEADQCFNAALALKGRGDILLRPVSIISQLNPKNEQGSWTKL